MSEGMFQSAFWTWFITLGTVFGIALCFFLIWWLGGESKQTGDEVDDTGHVWDEDLRELNNPLPRWWLGLFYITLVFGIVYLILYPGLGAFGGVLGWTQKQQYEEQIAEAEERYGPIFEQYSQISIEELGDDPKAMRTGERLYASYCTTCHGSDARGVRGFPNLRDDAWQWGGTPEAIKTSILDGRQAAMPPWRDVLGEEGVENVAHYVLSLNEGDRKFNREKADAGKSLYAANCAACHMPDGTGNPALGAPNLTDDEWLYGGSRRAIEASIAEGRQGRMPPHRNFLGEAKVHLLAAYVYHLEP